VTEAAAVMQNDLTVSDYVPVVRGNLAFILVQGFIGNNLGKAMARLTS
jgi:hypothetical protein